MPKLVVMRDGAVEGDRPLTGESLRVGRDSRNDVVLYDPAKSVSRFHAEIRAEADGYTVVDLNSRNGIWVNGKRVTTAALRSGTPVTLGSYQLSFQDEPPTDTYETVSRAGTATIGADAGRPPSAAQLKRPVTTQATRPRGTAARTGRNLWIGSALVVLLAVSIGAFAIVRHRAPREAPAPSSPVVVVPPDRPILLPDHQQEIGRYLAAAKDRIAHKDYDAALTSLSSALELEPTDPDARALKEEVDAANVALVSPPPPRPLPASGPVTARPPAKAPAPVDVLVAGISRPPGESPADYNARAMKIQDNYSRGKASLEKKDYRAALDSMAAVEREQPGYQDAGGLLAQAKTELHEAAREAMDNAAKNETAGEWYAAVQWYRHAEQFESTPELIERNRAAQERVTKEAYIAFDKANALRKLNDTAKAILQYQKVRDWLPADDEKRKEALKQLQVLKP